MMAASFAPPQGSGVSSLRSLDKVHVRQKLSCNKFVMTTVQGQEILYAKQRVRFAYTDEQGCFDYDIYDTHGQKVIKLRERYSLAPKRMEVSLGSQLVSIVRKQNTFSKPVFHVNNASDQLQFKIKGPSFHTMEADFHVYTPDKKIVGVISKLYGGLAKEMFTSADNFQISFPVELLENWKVALIGACLCIDATLYN